MSGNNLLCRHRAGARYPPRRSLNILDGDVGRRSGSGTRGSAVRPEPRSWATTAMRLSSLTPPTTDMDGQLQGMVMLTNLSVLMQVSLNLHTRFHIVNGQNITCYPLCCKLG